MMNYPSSLLDLEPAAKYLHGIFFDRANVFCGAESKSWESFGFKAELMNVVANIPPFRAPTNQQGADPGQPAAGLDLDAIERRASAATEGPWVKMVHHEHGADWWTVNRGVEIDGNVTAPSGRQLFRVMSMLKGADDAAFLAHARQDIPALIAEVRRFAAPVDNALAYPIYKLHELRREAEEDHAMGRTIGSAHVAVETRLIADILEKLQGAAGHPGSASTGVQS